MEQTVNQINRVGSPHPNFHVRAQYWYLSTPLLLPNQCPCPHCGTLLWVNESSNNCCGNGRFLSIVLPLNPLPPNFERYFDSATFRERDRGYNYMTSFAAIGISSISRIGGFVHIRGEANISIRGKIYRRIIQPNNESSIQWYVFDSNERYRCQNRFDLSNEICNDIRETLFELNPFAQSLRMISDDESTELDMVLRLRPERQEIAIIRNIPLDYDASRDVVLWNRNGQDRTFIRSYNALYYALSYPIFFPFGEHCWSNDLHSMHGITMREFMVSRFLRESRFTKCGRLGQELMLDVYTSIQEQRLNYIRAYQRDNQVIDNPESIDGNRVVQRRYLPSSIPGSPGYQRRLANDAMAIVRKHGKPTYFITITCNAQWPEVQSCLFPGQDACDRPDVTVRVFHSKLQQIMNKIRSGLFGPVIYYMYVIEFQGRGLPHCHLALKVIKEPQTSNEIDSIISARMPPNDERHRILYNVVNRFMVHHHGEKCRSEGSLICNKGFPKSYYPETTIDRRGFPIYKRLEACDSMVVPYNPYLLLLCNCHVNVELSANVNLIQYMYKYIFKGPDSTRFAFMSDDAITEFERGRYISSSMALWNLLNYQVNYRNPSVTSLPIHLKNRNNVIFRDGDSIGVLDNIGSPLDVYLNRPQSSDSDNLTYCEFFEKYRIVCRPTSESIEVTIPRGLNNATKYIVKRTRERLICRLDMILPSAGERFYLRQILLNRPVLNWDDLLVVEGVVYLTFEEVAVAMGLVDTSNNSIYYITMSEAINALAIPAYLRYLFIVFITDGAAPNELYDRFERHLMSDYLDGDRTPHQARNLLQIDLIQKLARMGKTIQDYNLPFEDSLQTINQIRQTYTTVFEDPTLQETHRHMIRCLNHQQRDLYNRIISELNSQSPTYVFIEGRAGCGKTFLQLALWHAITVRRQICLTTATTGIAALNLPNGRTVHNLFDLPVVHSGESVRSRIGISSNKADLLREAVLLIWDEFPTSHRQNIDAVDEILRSVRHDRRPFGGLSVIASGDFRQLPPVDTTNSMSVSVKSSPIWHAFERTSLSIPMRTHNDAKYSTFLDRLGDGRLNANMFISDLIPLPLSRVVDSEDALLHSIYDDANMLCLTGDRMILAFTNEVIDRLNARVLSLLETTSKTYIGINRIVNDEEGQYFDGADALGQMGMSGVPENVLTLKVGAICVLMRTLDSECGLVNSTLVRVAELRTNVILVRHVDQDGDPRPLMPIPRVWYEFVPKGHSFRMRRCQYPLRLAFACTVHKAQGKTLKRVGVDLRMDPFAHGQLYTALSRVRSASDVVVLSGDERMLESGIPKSRNVVNWWLLA